jgi:hypothetical protein
MSNFELDLPVAPAVMVGDEIFVEGSDVSEDKLEARSAAISELIDRQRRNQFLAKLSENS